MDLDEAFNEVATTLIADAFIKTKLVCFKNDSFRDTYNNSRTPEEKSQLLKSSAIFVTRGIQTYTLEVLGNILPQNIAKHLEDAGMRTYFKNLYHLRLETMRMAEASADIVHNLPEEQKTFFLRELKKTFNQEGIGQSDASKAYNFGLRDTASLANRALRI